MIYRLHDPNRVHLQLFGRCLTVNIWVSRRNPIDIHWDMSNAWRWLAWRLPRPLIMWAAVRLLCHGTGGKYGNTVVPELTAMDALKRWDEK